MQAILKSGLVNQNVNGYYDMYYNRIMFPLWNLNGQVVGFSGRIYDTNDSSKYINTKETDIFKKENFCIISIGPKMRLEELIP